MKYWIFILLCMATSLANAQQYVRGDYCGNVKKLAQQRGIEFTQNTYSALELALIVDMEASDMFLLAPTVTISILYRLNKDNPIEELTAPMKQDVLNLVLATWGKPDRYYTFVKQYNQGMMANQYQRNQQKKAIQQKMTQKLYQIYDNVLRNGTAANIVSVHDNYLIIQSEDGHKFKASKEDWNNPAYRKPEDMRK